MEHISKIKKGEVLEINDFTKVLKVEKGVIYLFFENNKIVNSCFVKMEDALFPRDKPKNRVELR
jgi:hypothetical protein